MAYVANEDGYDEYQSDAEIMYHISDTYLGRKPLLTPRIPRVAKESRENIRTKRICVSPSIEQCVLGIDGVSYMESSSLEVGKSWYVYQTTKKGKPARKVQDFDTTEEHWIKEETRFEYFGKLFRFQESDFAVLKNREIIFEFD
jgi:hypothetical protein